MGDQFKQLIHLVILDFVVILAFLIIRNTHIKLNKCVISHYLIDSPANCSLRTWKGDKEK